jgi:hypothetical protein
MGIAAAAHNIRLYRSWHKQHSLGDPEHPLLTPDSETLLLHLTPEQYAGYAAFLAHQAAADGAEAA